jgi:hypothetical protein
MNIQTVRDNLKNTIAGKEAYLARLGNTRDMNDGAAMAVEATRDMLEINLTELKRILGDVEQCIPAETDSKRDLMKGLWKV